MGSSRLYRMLTDPTTGSIVPDEAVLAQLAELGLDGSAVRRSLRMRECNALTAAYHLMHEAHAERAAKHAAAAAAAVAAVVAKQQQQEAAEREAGWDISSLSPTRQAAPRPKTASATSSPSRYANLSTDRRLCSFCTFCCHSSLCRQRSNLHIHPLLAVAALAQSTPPHSPLATQHALVMPSHPACPYPSFHPACAHHHAFPARLCRFHQEAGSVSPLKQRPPVPAYPGGAKHVVPPPPAEQEPGAFTIKAIHSSGSHGSPVRPPTALLAPAGGAVPGAPKATSLFEGGGAADHLLQQQQQQQFAAKQAVTGRVP